MGKTGRSDYYCTCIRYRVLYSLRIDLGSTGSPSTRASNAMDGGVADTTCYTHAQTINRQKRVGARHPPHSTSRPKSTCIENSCNGRCGYCGGADARAASAPASSSVTCFSYAARAAPCSRERPAASRAPKSIGRNLHGANACVRSIQNFSGRPPLGRKNTCLSIMCGYDPGAYIKTVLFSLLITYYTAVWPQEEEPPVQQPRVARRDDERGSAGPMEPGRISTFLEFNRHKHDGSQPDLR